MSKQPAISFPLEEGFALTEQVVRLQALLEASRRVHSTIDRMEVLEQAARIVVRELEMKGALFTDPLVLYGELPVGAANTPCPGCPRFALRSRGGILLSELVVATPDERSLNVYEQDFLDGLALQTAIALENAINHQRHLDYARLAQDLDAARSIQQSLLPQITPDIPGYSLATRSNACYQVGGDYLDLVAEPDGSYLMLIADVAGKGLASALMCTSFRSAFRVLARQSLSLEELANRLSQQHWDEGDEARRRYVTALFVRLHAESGELEFLNAGHNPAFLVDPKANMLHRVEASGTPLGLLPGSAYVGERRILAPGSRLLLYTDGLTEVFRGEEEFGQERLEDLFARTENLSEPTASSILDLLWTTLDTFTDGAPQQDDMSAIALCRAGVAFQERA